MIRQDKFQEGDRVEFVEEDPYTGSDFAGAHRKKHGTGPYLVEEIFELKYGYRDAGHTQIVYINNTGYSGEWFKPLRKS